MADFQLYAAHPNPVREVTNIIFSLPAAGGAALRVYDVTGRCVRTLVQGQQQSGYHVAVFDGKTDAGALLPAGIYFYRLDAVGKTATRKLILSH